MSGMEAAPSVLQSFEAMNVKSSEQRRNTLVRGRDDRSMTADSS